MTVWILGMEGYSLQLRQNLISSIMASRKNAQSALRNVRMCEDLQAALLQALFPTSDSRWSHQQIWEHPPELRITDPDVTSCRVQQTDMHTSKIRWPAPRKRYVARNHIIRTQRPLL
jgi:hypothetical protein